MFIKRIINKSLGLTTIGLLVVGFLTSCTINVKHSGVEPKKETKEVSKSTKPSLLQTQQPNKKEVEANQVTPNTSNKIVVGVVSVEENLKDIADNTSKMNELLGEGYNLLKKVAYLLLKREGKLKVYTLVSKN